jgi:hypothetical protein
MRFPSSVIAVFLLSAAYWLYLALATQMGITSDALGYEHLAQMLAAKGWVSYFTTGPNREPLYPLLVMLSMDLQGLSGIAYTKIMAFLCVLILGATQFLMYLVLKKSGVRTPICVVTMAYFAVSPAMNNAAFSLFSEIAALPLIILLLLANIRAYQTIRAGTAKDALCAGLYLGLVFTAITFVKGIFEFIFLVFALLYLFALLACFVQGKKSMAANCLLILLAFTVCYQGPLTAYKLLNKKYNGHCVLTNRGSWALYASCARRAEKLTPDRLLTALAYIPGKGFCESAFGEEKCRFWGIENLDSIGQKKYQQVSSQVPPSMVDQRMMTLSKEAIMQNPAQFLLLMGFDGIKMFFWESTQIGFVTYPPWLQGLYDNRLLKNTWRAVISLLSLAGFIFLIIVSFKKAPDFFKFNTDAGTYIIFIFIVLSSFIGFYALFDTIPRFALPVAPLELITIALLAEAMYNGTHAKNYGHLRP